MVAASAHVVKPLWPTALRLLRHVGLATFQYFTAVTQKYTWKLSSVHRVCGLKIPEPV